MQSANKLNSISLLSILMPLMFVSFILFAQVSNAVTNKYAENRHHWLTSH